MNSILVAFATRYGSTGEVADAVAERLRGHGLAVEVKPVKEVRAVDGYRRRRRRRALLFGFHAQGGAHLPGAAARARSRPSPSALFALGPTSAADDLAEASVQLDKALAKLPWLQPVAAEMFVGKYDPAKLRFADRLVTKPPASPLHGLEAHDDRDWAAIGAWADDVSQALIAA